MAEMLERVVVSVGSTSNQRPKWLWLHPPPSIEWRRKLRKITNKVTFSWRRCKIILLPPLSYRSCNNEALHPSSTGERRRRNKACPQLPRRAAFGPHPSVYVQGGAALSPHSEKEDGLRAGEGSNALP